MFARVIKDFCILLGILGMFFIAGFRMLPAVIKFSIPQMIEKTTGRKATLGNFELNPLSLQLCFRGFTLQDTDGKTFSAFDKFYIDIGAVDSIKESALVIDKVSLSKPSVRLVRDKDGQFNFDDLVKQEKEAEPDGGPLFPLTIRQLSVSEGKLSWEDNQSGKAVKEEIQSVNFEITDFSTHDSKQFPANLSFVVESVGRLDWQGTTGVSPVFSSGHLKADDVDLKKIVALAAPNASAFDLQGKGFVDLDYTIGYEGKTLDLGIEKSRLQLNAVKFSEKVQGGFNVSIQKSVLESDYQFKLNGSQWRFNANKSKLDMEKVLLPELASSKATIEVPKAMLEAGYRADNAGKDLNFVFTGNKLALKNASLAESQQSQKLVAMPEVTVQGVGFNLGSRELTVKTAKAADAEIKAWLNADGGINYQDLFKNPNDEGAGSNENPQTESTDGAPFQISVQNLELKNFDINFEDRTQKAPVAFNADSVNLKLTGYTNKAGAKLPLQFSADINETGSIKLDGDIVADPFSARLNVAVKGIELERLQPYIQPHARLDLLDGRLEADGFLTAAFPSAESADIKFKGNTAIADLLTRDQILNKDFIKWRRLSLSGIDVDVAANRYTANLLLIEKPYARVVIDKDKTININDVLGGAEGKPESSIAKTETASKADKIYYQLNKIQIADGSSDFADLSLILPFAAKIKGLNGGATGISSERKSTIKASLKGNAYDLAPVEIYGDISPYQGSYNVEMNFYGMPMPLVSPYMVQFAGYKVEKGKLTLRLKYKVENRQLTASNSILIDQFVLGEKVEHPGAVSIPLKLAAALLKDADGKIKMDVPITGSLEDPKFSIGKIVREALLKSITKIIASPFKAIGSIFRGGADMSTVSFSPGKAKLDSEQITKLYVLAQALKDRPALTLDIKGAAYEQEDWPALKEAALYDLAKKIKAEELAKKEGKKVQAKDITLTEEEYKRLLADKFIEKFPLLAEKSLFGKPRLIHPEGGDFYEVAKQKLSELIKPDEGRLKRLAERRAQAIAQYVVQKGGVSNERVYVLDAAVDPQRETAEVVSFLSLNAK